MKEMPAASERTAGVDPGKGAGGGWAAPGAGGQAFPVAKIARRRKGAMSLPREGNLLSHCK